MGDQVTPQTLSQALDRWRRVAANMTFRKAWPWEMRFETAVSPLIDGIELRVALRSPDIVTGEDQWVHLKEVIPMRRLLDSDDADIARCVRSLLLNLVTHEFDECLLIGGEQMRDPHAKERACHRWKGAA